MLDRQRKIVQSTVPVLQEHGDAMETGSVHNEQPCKLGRARLVRELFNGGCGVNEWVKLSEIAAVKGGIKGDHWGGAKWSH